MVSLSNRQRRSGLHIEVLGAKDFERDLVKFITGLNDLSELYDDIATLLRDAARSAAPGRTKGAIRKQKTPQGAYVNIVRNPPYAIGKFMGANRRFGWYEHPRYQQSAARQFEPWVGPAWLPGSTLDMPYFIGPAMNAVVPEILDRVGDWVEDQAGKDAFPGRK